MASYESDNDSTSAPESSRSWKSSSNLSLISLSRRSSFSSSTSAATGLVPTKPHKANHAAWEAITRLRREKGGRVGLEHFRLLRRVGSGDIGSVYLCQIRNPAVGAPPCFYAMKVVDREALAARKKLVRAEVEKEILAMLDHPFLPTLYAEFEASHYSCLVMEFCPGGDLFGLRLRQPSRTFPVSSAKFYAAETLLALEYLHMMGIVYRDLKPENVLVREDGHIMLTDFDLSLKCDVVPKLLKPKLPPNIERSYSPRCSTPSCSTPLRPVLSCFLSNYSMSNPACTPRRTTTIRERANPNDEEEAATEQEEDQGRSGFNTELVAEPLDARSKSFVGTHEYLAPEVISGHGHGSAVDWWTFGVFLYEMLYGRTPFKGENNEKTLVNILKQPVLFPRLHSSSAREYEEIVRVQDLISKLLVKNPKKRIGSLKGSVEIKRHEFFKGVNWALIRSAKPPMVPREVHNNRIRTSNVAKALTKKERDQPYQIPHHFDYF